MVTMQLSAHSEKKTAPFAAVSVSIMVNDEAAPFLFGMQLENAKSLNKHLTLSTGSG